MAVKTAGRYRRGEQIGFGNFGVVYKGVDTVTNRVVAIKSLDLDSVNDEVETVQHEVALLAQLSSAESSNVTKYYGTVLQGSKLWIIMDLCYGGSVRTLLRPGVIEEKLLSVLFREISIAVKAIHSQGIIHRDIKAANVLITMSGQVKLCDFGVAAVNPHNVQTKRQTIVGTPYWMAPEVIQEGQSYTNKADIWSLGITFYEIVTGNPPYSDQEAMRAMMLITSSRPPRLEGPKYSPALKDLVALCLDEVPDARPEAEDLLKHKFVKMYQKTSVSVLRSLVDRYSAWKERHRDQRDSLLMFNPHKNSDDANDNDNDNESVWDFNTEESDASSEYGQESEDPNSGLADAPDSLRELFGVPPKQYDDAPMESQYENAYIRSSGSESNSGTMTPIGAGTPMGTVTPSVTAAASSLFGEAGFAFPPLKPPQASTANSSVNTSNSTSTSGTTAATAIPERAQLSRIPTAISVSRMRSTTVASPLLGNGQASGSWTGWRARHGSEAQLDTLKHPNRNPRVADQGTPFSEPSSVAISRQNSLDPLQTHPSVQTNNSTDPTSLASPHSPTAAQTASVGSPSSSPSPKRNTGRPVAMGNKPRQALPRLQMPPRNTFKSVPLMSAPAGPGKPVHMAMPVKRMSEVWISEFPPMPSIDCNVWLDSTPEKLATDHLLELLLGYKTAINSLAGQLRDLEH